MNLDYELKQYKGNQNFSKDLNELADLNIAKEEPTYIQESDEQLEGKEFIVNENKKNLGESKEAINNLTTNITTLFKKFETYEDWNDFLLRVTNMLNSIIVEEYQFTKMLSCPDLDSIEGKYGPRFQQKSLYDLFILNSKRNEEIFHSVYDKERKQNKTCFWLLTRTSFKDMRAYYKKGCKTMALEPYINYLNDHLNKVEKEEPKKGRKRERKKPKDKIVRKKKVRKQ